MYFAAVPNRPKPAKEEKGNCYHLKKADHEGAAVPAAALVAVRLKHCSDSRQEDVKQEDQTRPRYWVDMFVAAHSFIK
jgi:hypothetical protein